MERAVSPSFRLIVGNRQVLGKQDWQTTGGSYCGGSCKCQHILEPQIDPDGGWKKKLNLTCYLHRLADEADWSSTTRSRYTRSWLASWARFARMFLFLVSFVMLMCLRGLEILNGVEIARSRQTSRQNILRRSMNEAIEMESALPSQSQQRLSTDCFAKELSLASRRMSL